MEIEDQPSSNKYQFIELVQRERVAVILVQETPTAIPYATK
jgi:hypothetical protein